MAANTEGSDSEDRNEKRARDAIQEARMVLPGIQALFGFQLIAAFNQRFNQIGAADQILHFTALVLVALAIAIIMAPAAYHRIVEQGSVSSFFVKLASWLIAAAMVPLMIALCLEVYLVGHLILSSQLIGIVVAASLLLVFTGLWFVFPFSALLSAQSSMAVKRAAYKTCTQEREPGHREPNV